MPGSTKPPDDPVATAETNPSSKKARKHSLTISLLVAVLFVACLLYYAVLTPDRFGAYHDDSIYVTTGTVLLTTLCAVLAGYALVHLRPRGGGIIVAALLISLYFPTRVVSIISIYEIQDYLDLINSTSGLILP